VPPGDTADRLRRGDGATVTGQGTGSTGGTIAGPDVPGQPGRAAPEIAGYEVLAELGRGGMGLVYKGRQVLLDRPCALKMILAGAHASPEAAARFLGEATTVARIEHPNVVQIRHIGEADGLPYFELEYIEGGSLDRRLDGTPWPAPRAAALVEAVARGVAEAHRLGIVHRDLKPANVLLAATAAR
jgi:serine/threonine-protein kinase